MGGGRLGVQLETELSCIYLIDTQEASMIKVSVGHRRVWAININLELLAYGFKAMSLNEIIEGLNCRQIRKDFQGLSPGVLEH